MKRLRIAIVVPRYGPEVNGGAEVLARSYAWHVGEHADVTVLTTCALDYRTWEDHFPPGDSNDGPVRIRRFPVPAPRAERAFDALSADVLTRAASPEEEIAWMDAQGPVSPGLEEHLAMRGDEYDVVLFVPYLYATTYRSLPHVADRAVLVPALHDEPPLKLRIFDELFALPQAFVFSTPEERQLAERRFAIPSSRCHIIGTGIDEQRRHEPHAFATSHGIDRPYVLALGRIDPSKGSGDLIDMHRAYRLTRPFGADLVMAGRSIMEVPDEEWLHTTGFLESEDEKRDALAGCVALVTASPYESLSLVLLEAWAQGRPAIVTSRSDVLTAQVRRAQAGLCFDNAAEYAACIDLLAARPAIAWALGRAGWRFARAMGWPKVTTRLMTVLEGVA